VPPAILLETRVNFWAATVQTTASLFRKLQKVIVAASLLGKVTLHNNVPSLSGTLYLLEYVPLTGVMKPNSRAAEIPVEDRGS
jgi:hypothetical protein